MKVVFLAVALLAAAARASDVIEDPATLTRETDGTIEVEQLESTYTRLGALRTASLAYLSAVKERYSAVIANAKQQKDAIEQIDSDFHNVEAEVVLANQKLDATQASLKDAAAGQQHLEREVAELEVALAKALSDAQAAADNQQKALKDQQVHLQRSTDDLQKFLAAVREKCGERDAVKDKVTELEAAFTTATEDSEAQKARLAAMEDALARLNQDLEAAKNDGTLATMRDQVQLLQAREKEARDFSEQARLEIAERERQISEKFRAERERIQQERSDALLSDQVSVVPSVEGADRESEMDDLSAQIDSMFGDDDDDVDVGEVDMDEDIELLPPADEQIIDSLLSVSRSLRGSAAATAQSRHMARITAKTPPDVSAVVGQLGVHLAALRDKVKAICEEAKRIHKEGEDAIGVDPSLLPTKLNELKQLQEVLARVIADQQRAADELNKVLAKIEEIKLQKARQQQEIEEKIVQLQAAAAASKDEALKVMAAVDKVTQDLLDSQSALKACLDENEDLALRATQLERERADLERGNEASRRQAEALERTRDSVSTELDQVRRMIEDEKKALADEAARLDAEIKIAQVEGTVMNAEVQGLTARVDRTVQRHALDQNGNPMPNPDQQAPILLQEQ